MSDRLIFNVVVTLLIIVCSIPVVIDNSSETPMFIHIGQENISVRQDVIRQTFLPSTS